MDNISGNKFSNQWIQASSDGKIEAFLAAGKYRLHIDPRSEGVSQTVTDFFTMPDTTTLTTFTFALNVPNVTGTVTPEASSRYSSVCFETYEQLSALILNAAKTDAEHFFEQYDLDKYLHHHFPTPISNHE